MAQSSVSKCNTFAEDFINTVEKNHLYMEQSLQTSYTAAFYYLFQNVVRREVLNSSSGSSTTSLAFAGNLQLMDVQVSIPTTNAVISLVGCAVLVVMCIEITKRSEHLLQERASTEIVVEAMMNSTKYPTWLLKMELKQIAAQDSKRFSLQDLHVVNVILHDNEENKYVFHIDSEM